MKSVSRSQFLDMHIFTYFFPPFLSLFCLHIVQVAEGVEEAATRMTVGIGILGVGEAALAVVATGTATEGLAMGRRVPSVAIRLKMVAAMEVMVVIQVVAMTTTITATARGILVLRQIRWVPLVTRASRAPLNLGRCRGPVRMA